MGRTRRRRRWWDGPRTRPDGRPRARDRLARPRSPTPRWFAVEVGGPVEHPVGVGAIRRAQQPLGLDDRSGLAGGQRVGHVVEGPDVAVLRLVLGCLAAEAAGAQPGGEHHHEGEHPAEPVPWPVCGRTGAGSARAWRAASQSRTEPDNRSSPPLTCRKHGTMSDVTIPSPGRPGRRAVPVGRVRPHHRRSTTTTGLRRGGRAPRRPRRRVPPQRAQRRSSRPSAATRTRSTATAWSTGSGSRTAPPATATGPCGPRSCGPSSRRPRHLGRHRHALHPRRRRRSGRAGQRLQAAARHQHHPPRRPLPGAGRGRRRRSR